MRGSRCSLSPPVTCRTHGHPRSAPQQPGLGALRFRLCTSGTRPPQPLPCCPWGRRLPEPPPCTLSTQARCRPSQPGALESTQLPEQRGSRAEPAAPPPHNPAIVPAAAPRPPAPRHLHPPGAASSSRGPGRGVPGCGGHRQGPPPATGATPRPHTSWPLFPGPCLGC